MKIEDIGLIINNFLTDSNSYNSILVDGSWGCGKTTQIRKCINDHCNKNIIYVSLFGVKSTDELSKCFFKTGNLVKKISAVTSVGSSVIPIVGNSISSALSNVLDQYSDIKKVKKNKIFIFDDLERVNQEMSLISLLGFFNTLMLNNCKVLCLSALDQIIDKEKKDEFDRFTEKAFDRVYHIDEKPSEIYKSIFSDLEANNIDRISDGFHGNIRLAKRSYALCKNAIKHIDSFKDKTHDFYKNHTIDDLICSSVVAVNIIYCERKTIFSENDRKSYMYLFLRERSVYFGNKISNNYIGEYLNKKSENEHNISLESSLTRSLIYLEMFDNEKYLKEDCEIPLDVSNPNNSLLSYSTFYLLDDKDKRKSFNLLVEGIRNNSICVAPAIISLIGQIHDYTDFVLPDDIVQKIIADVTSQVENGDDSTLDKINDQKLFIKNNSYVMDKIFERIKVNVDNNRIHKIQNDIIKAYKESDYSSLTNFYYELSENSLFKYKDKFSDFTIENNYFLPSLEKTINSQMWSFCHQIARYCKAVNIVDEFINYLRMYVKKYPDEKSLKNKAFALIYYNIDKNIEASFFED